jgi:uncharacterized metal-binding protein YceD (DUF177 family)
MELSHVVRLDRLGSRPQVIKLTPHDAIKAALASRFGLLEMSSFEANLQVRRRTDTGWIEVSGTIRSDVVQECVVSLEPIPAHVEAEIAEVFVEEGVDEDTGSGRRGREAVDLDPIADDPEPLVDGVLDVGEIAAQALSLALDPYPRAAAADGEVDETDVPVVSVDPERDGDGDGKVLPFARLAELKERLAGGPGVKKT